MAVIGVHWGTYTGLQWAVPKYPNPVNFHIKILAEIIAKTLMQDQSNLFSSGSNKHNSDL